MNAVSWLNFAVSQGIARLDAEVILSFVLQQDRAFLYSHPELPLSPNQSISANNLLQKRLQHIPLAYLLGKKEFYGRNFYVSPDVLIPRPATETIIEVAKRYQFSNIIDVGTGSGCIAITLALELPNSQIVATDISPAALKVARRNASAYNLQDNPHFLRADLLPKNDQKYQAIIANLPYVDPSWHWSSPELQFEPSVALFANNGGLAVIKRLIKTAPQYLRPKGYLILEADLTQHDEIITFARSYQFKVDQIADLILVLQLL